jgi:hypothetical protein
LLWLEEITRDPENQLLWSEQIVLAKPNLFKQLAEGFKDRQTVPRKKPDFPSVSSRSLREKVPYRRGIVSGVSLTLLLLLVGWLLHQRLGSKLNFSTAQISATPATSPKAGSSTPVDPFVQAVRLAEQASAANRSVKTSAQWLDVAAKWERASDFMSAVKPNDSRYKTAQNRMLLYRKNSEAAQKQATQKRS